MIQRAIITRNIHYIVNAKDYPNALERRLAVRDQHLKRAAKLKENGFILLGGATLKDEIMNGSFLLISADNEEEVKDYIKTDVYHKSKVWETVEIKEFRLAAISPHLKN